MTVYELIVWLKKMPMTAKVYRTDGEYNGSISLVNGVNYNKEVSLGREKDTVIIS